MKKLEIKGLRFGYLIALERASKNEKGCYPWVFLCVCGNKKEFVPSRVRNGHTKTCGCMYGSKVIKHGMFDKNIYHVWQAIKQRCLNPKCKFYKSYGARGIRICEKWLDFKGFYEDMKDGYTQDLTIDRIDVNGNYCKENCRWVDRLTQGNNTTRNVYFIYKGEQKTLSQLSVIAGISRSTMQARIGRGWSVEKTVEKTEKYGKRA